VRAVLLLGLALATGCASGRGAANDASSRALAVSKLEVGQRIRVRDDGPGAGWREGTVQRLNFHHGGIVERCWGFAEENEVDEQGRPSFQLMLLLPSTPIEIWGADVGASTPSWVPVSLEGVLDPERCRGEVTGSTAPADPSER